MEKLEQLQKDYGQARTLYRQALLNENRSLLLAMGATDGRMVNVYRLQDVSRFPEIRKTAIPEFKPYEFILSNFGLNDEGELLAAGWETEKEKESYFFPEEELDIKDLETIRESLIGLRDQLVKGEIILSKNLTAKIKE